LKVSIKQDGTYLLSKLIGGSKQVDAWGVGSLVTGKIRTALSGSKSGETAVMGVRGAAATRPPAEVEWIEAAESSEYLEKGKAFLQRTQYSEALGAFNEGLSVSHDEEGQLFFYYIGYTQYLQGHTALALKTLERVNVDPERSYYADLILLRGRLLIESLSFEEALGLFGAHINRCPEGDLTQALLLLSSFCYRRLGDLNEARSALQRSYALDPSTELGSEARRLLQEL
jgi:tetratricopeptide (TPR) repeat protein